MAPSVSLHTSTDMMYDEMCRIHGYFPFPRIIAAYSSYPQSGKSILAKHMRAQYGYEILKFADPMKEMLTNLLLFIGIPAEEIPRYIEGDLKETPIPEFGGKSVRDMLISLGTMWGRNMVAPDIWVNIAYFQMVNRFRYGSPNLIFFDDLRQENEYEMLRDMGACIVRVSGRVHPYKPGHERLLDNHEFDVELYNGPDTPLDEFFSRSLTSISRWYMENSSE